MGFLLASKVVASVLPSEQPNTRNRLLQSHEKNHITSNIQAKASWPRILLITIIMDQA